MVKKVSKHTKLMYALIAAIVALVALLGSRLKEGFQSDEKLYQSVGYRMESSDASIKKNMILENNKSSLPGAKITNISTGEVVLSTSDTKEVITSQITSTSGSSTGVGTITIDVYAILTNKLTDSTDIKMYEVIMPPMGPNISAAEYEQAKKNFDSRQTGKEIKNMIVKKISTGELIYYPPLSSSQGISDKIKDYFDRLGRWDLSNLEKGLTIGVGVVIGLIVLKIIFSIIF